jgi:hypothetical protein
LSIIINAGQAKSRQFVTDGAFALHQPTSGADTHKITGLWRRRQCHDPILVAVI